MNIVDSVRALRSVKLLIVLGLALLATASRAHAAPLALSGDQSPLRFASRTSVAWLGAAGDGRWSNPANWEGHRVPGPDDIVRFDADSPDAQVDAAFAGVVAGVELEPGFAGTLSLNRALAVRGDLTMQGGTLAGETADLWIQSTARVTGGLLTTPSGTMHAERMQIQAPGIVRMGVNGKLNLAGESTPLMGDGVLDVATNVPNSIEYTGQETSDLFAASPLNDLGTGRVDDQASQALNVLRRAASPPRNAPQFTEAGSLVLNAGENSLWSAVIDPARGYAYFGTDTNPGRVVKVRLSDLTRVGSITLDSGEKYLDSAVLDSANGYAYFGTGCFSADPGRVVKIRLSDFTRVAALGSRDFCSAVLDAANGYAYFGTSGYVLKVRLSDFTMVGAANLNSGEVNLKSAVLDSVNGYAYFGTAPYSSPGQVIKIRLSDLTRVDALALGPGEGGLWSAVLDSTNGYAYFGTNTSPGKILKIRLSDFTRVDSLTLNSDEADLSSAALDASNGYAYFGTGTSPGKVVKVRLADFTRTGALTLTAGEDSLSSAVNTPINGYAYFGTNTSPGIVVRVDLWDTRRESFLPLITR